MPTRWALALDADGNQIHAVIPEGTRWLYVSRSHATCADTAVVRVARDRVASLSIGGANDRGRASPQRAVWLHERDARERSAWWARRLERKGLGPAGLAEEIEAFAGEWPVADPMTWEPIVPSASGGAA